jgi:hypothetical protein
MDSQRLPQQKRAFIFAGSAIQERILQYSGDVMFYNTEDSYIGIRFSNFDDFSARNLASYAFGIKSRLRLYHFLFVINELSIQYGENVARLSSVYGMAYTGGIIFSW